MTKTKMFFGEKRLKDIYVGATKWEVFKFKIMRMTKRAMFVMASVSVIGWSVVAGSYYIPRTVYADKEVIKQVESDLPILNRIIKCESGGVQYGKNGQLLVNINVQDDGTKSIDVGIGQINVQVWGETATKMGYDLTKEKDNLAFTRWLFVNKGSVPWSATFKCWR